MKDNFPKIKYLPSLFIAVIMTLISCSGKDKFQNLRWEGIQGTTLRVYVRYIFNEEPDDVFISEKLPGIILDEARQRCRLILYNHLISRKINDPEIMKFIEMKFILKKKVHTDCSDEYCYGYFDFDISSFMKVIKKSEEGLKPSVTPR